MRYTLNTKPDCLLLAEREAATERPNAHDVLRAKLRRVGQVYVRASFWRDDIYVSELFKDWRTCWDAGHSVQDAENAYRENLYDYSYAHENPSECDLEHGDDARALFRYLCPDATPHAVAERSEAILADLLRALDDAERDDLESQFYDWAVSHIVDSAEGSGLRWCLLDDEGKPTEWPYEAERIAFSCTRAEYLKRDSVFCGHVFICRNDPLREVIEDRDDRMGNYLRDEVIDDAQRNGTPEDFDPRGGRYGDRDQWPSRFIEYAESVDAWRHDVRKMRERLKAMIRARAPLAERAALVAAIYGIPGSIVEDSED